MTWTQLPLESNWSGPLPSTEYFKPQIGNLGNYAVLRGGINTGNFVSGEKIASIPTPFSSAYDKAFLVPAVYEEVLSPSYTRTWIIPLNIDPRGSTLKISVPVISSGDLINISGTIGTIWLDGLIYPRGGNDILYLEENLSIGENFTANLSSTTYFRPTVFTEYDNSNINLRIFSGRIHTSNFLDTGANGEWAILGTYAARQSLRGNYPHTGICMSYDNIYKEWKSIILYIDELNGLIKIPSHQLDSSSGNIDIWLDGIRFVPGNTKLSTTAYGSPNFPISMSWSSPRFGARPAAPYSYSAIASANIEVWITDRVVPSPVDYVIGRLSDASGELSPGRTMKFPAKVYLNSPTEGWFDSHVVVKNGNNQYGIPQTVVTYSRYEYLTQNNFVVFASPFWNMATEPF